MTGFSALPLAEQDAQHHDAHLAGVSKILGPRWAQLPAVTVGLLGVQVFWSVEMSYGTPYLLSLGLTKAAVAIVFLAGPISGLVVQPLIGVLADNSMSRFGRRRPYMIVGCIVCTSAMLLLGFTRPVASVFTSSPSPANDVLTICLAIVALFTIDFSINAVQAVDRALIVDTLPSAEQADANAWAARMLGFGSVAGYFIGNVDMTSVFPFFGSTELEVLAVVGSLLLLATHALTAFCTKEKVVVSSRRLGKTFANELRDIWDHAFSLPPAIRQICLIQFFSWMGWFPVLFYTTAFIGDLHKASSALPPSDPDLDAEATRLGTRALFYSSLLSFTGNVLLPFIVAESARSRRLLERKLAQARRSAWLRLYDRSKIGLPTLWAVGHLLFAVCMFATFFYTSVEGATFFTTLTGFSWSITQWAPFSLLAEAILTEDAHDGEAPVIVLNDTRSRRRSGSLTLAGDDQERQFLVGSEDEDDSPNQLYTAPTTAQSPHRRSPSREDDDTGASHVFLQNAMARTSHVDVHSVSLSDPETLHADLEAPRGKAGSGLAAKAGIIIGIHNIFIVIPQFIMTGLASIIFALLDPTKRGSGVVDPPLSTNGTVMDPADAFARQEAVVSGSGPNSYAIIYRIGGLSAVVAFVLTLRLARELRHH
ncbi:MFS general substrate transporter [Dichomitus squalens]|uniref:MFS general substrate transporter n=1 Tax=Dichomitus squalens TaxID=114155 RepID=A0A4V2K6F8_9APHY|nr:MFS general substrate transporter [Dichomitus squalens]